MCNKVRELDTAQAPLEEVSKAILIEACLVHPKGTDRKYITAG